MSQITIDGSPKHRIQFMNALKSAVSNGDLTQYQADKLRKEYDD